MHHHGNDYLNGAFWISPDITLPNHNEWKKKNRGQTEKRKMQEIQ